MLFLRSTLYVIGVLLNTILFAFVLVVCIPLPYPLRYGLVRLWCRFALWWLKICCGLRFRVLGAEHLPAQGSVVLSKHQSAWETIALPTLLPLQTWVLKKELLWLPFFGWGLASLKPIAIERARSVRAFKQLVAQGKARLAEGIWIVVFPEGTRVPAGEQGRYQPGGAKLACAANAPVVPVAVNSGEFWPRNSWLKYPGQITLSVGPAISTAGKSAEQVTREAESWIEHEMLRISGVGPCYPHAQRDEAVHHAG